MAKYTINGTINPVETATIHNSTVLVGTNYHFSVAGMTPSTKKRLHPVGPVRTGFLDAMRTARTTYDTQLNNTSFDLSAYDANHALYLQNKIMKNELKVLLDNMELIEEVALNNEYEDALSIYKNLQTIGETDANIHAFIIDEGQTHFHRAEANLPNITTITPGTKTTVNHCTTGKRGSNTGVTVLGFNHKGASVASQIIVLSGDTFVIPAGWVDIEVENKSTTVDGEFSLPGKH